MRGRSVGVAFRIIMLSAHAQTQDSGGQPRPGAKQSVPDLDTQVAYQRAFEATLRAMPAVAIYRCRVVFYRASMASEGTYGSASQVPLMDLFFRPSAA